MTPPGGAPTLILVATANGSGHTEVGMKRAALGLLLILFAGCVTEPKVLYEKPGVPEAEMKKDHTACVRDSITGEDQILSNLLKLDRAAYKRCMEGRGYSIRVQS